jgi:tRNA-dihydrouridine synthase A
MAISTTSKYPVSIAPMMDCTDRHYRFMMRFLTRKTLLYTEMVTTGAILFGDKKRHLDFSPEELPLALQLGGDDPEALIKCAVLAQQWGYTEVNINVGCPSDRVKNGQFGASLMARPERVAECVAAMKAEVDIPVTVKHRIGIDDLDRYEDMKNFVSIVAEADCDRFSVHARKAWLQGLSPKQNRTVPPLRYEDVYRLKEELPELEIEINGGIRELDEFSTHLEKLDAVMIGRAAYENPTMFAAVDGRFYGVEAEHSSLVKTRRALIEAMFPYVETVLKSDAWLSRITRHMHGLFSGMKGTRAWKRFMAENAYGPEANLDTLKRAMDVVPVETLDAPLVWAEGNAEGSSRLARE